MFEFLMVFETCLLIAVLCVLVRCFRTLAHLDASLCTESRGSDASGITNQIIIEPDKADRLSARNVKLHEIAESVSLTDRERDILEYVYRGWKAKAIGTELCISEATVKTHMGNIYRKFDVHSQQEVIATVDSFSVNTQDCPLLCDG